MNDTLKKTALYDEHVKLGARMVPFAGWVMPIQYTGILDEHKAVREHVGLFDVSHMGEVFVSGKDSLNFLQKILPQDISKLAEYKAIYCQLTTLSGGIIDDLIVYRLKDENNFRKFLLIINASRISEDIDWFFKNKNKNCFDVEIDNQSDNYSMLALQGPDSSAIIEKLGIEIEEQPAYFEIKECSINSTTVLLARTGYTGEDGFEILVKNDNAKALWSAFFENGEEFNLKPIGLGARDTLRLEAALPLYGQELDESTTPIEASIGWSVSKEKQNEYNGKEVIMAQFDKKPSKRLVGFKMVDKAIPRHDYEIYKNENLIGKVTSGGVAPSIQANIGLGYIDSTETFKIGEEIYIKVREKFCKAQIAKRPFIVKSTKSK